MARFINPTLAEFRLPGEYARLLTQERKRVAAPDYRLRLEASDEEWQAICAQARANAKPSALLRRLERGHPVTVDVRALSREYVALRRSPYAPAWTHDGSVTSVSMTCEDVLLPVDG
jgi:hypothetical protein